MVLRELKKNPHRIVYMGSGENQSYFDYSKGQMIEIETNQIPINDGHRMGPLLR